MVHLGPCYIDTLVFLRTAEGTVEQMQIYMLPLGED